ncbi:MAG: hypothetical protein JO359_10025 [Candidatus Eremiobacteraeota bacterium]|nr:hypothetical protein [Candidatus Eremiobacteraeota bacterium]
MTNRGALAAFVLLLSVAASGRNAAAQALPTPSPSPSATPDQKIHIAIEAHATYVGQGTRGPGVTPPEGPGFAGGSPVSPLTPYDTLSSAPLTPGNALESALIVTPTYAGKQFQISAQLGVGYLAGSSTLASYWGESIFPTLNPHLGSQLLPLHIVFPTHAGSDDATAIVASVLSGSIGTRDGKFVVRGGWFDLAQTDQFVFTQPALTNFNPAIGFATAETLGGGAPSIDWWQSAASQLPLRGMDAVYKQGLATVEAATAALPSLPGTSARLNIGSLVIDHGEGTRYSAEVVGVTTGGLPVATTVLYGSNPQIVHSPQGDLPVSTIGGQRQTILGIRAAFHATSALDAILEYGHSTYAADMVALAGTGKPGNYYHAAISRTVGRWSAGADYYRNEPYYAQALLPYGVPENVWSIAWSWPGQWLKSNYQIINNFPVNVNRQGYRLHYSLSGGAIELKTSFAFFQQIDPIGFSNAYRTGFVDGFFLPQNDAGATLGNQHQFVLWGAWHPAFGDLTLDYDQDTMFRRAYAANPQDAVSYFAPSYVLTFAHRFGPNLLASAGYGRYAMRGSFAQAFTNVDFAQNVGMLGAQWQESATTATLASIRWSGLNGLPSIPFVGPSPAFSGTLFVLEQRIKM